MTDFLNNIVTLILIFLLLVVAPLNLAYMLTEGANTRLIFNQTENFLDSMTDKKEITEDDINNLYMSLNSYGLVIDVNVERLVRTSVEAPDGRIKTMWTSVDPDSKEAAENRGEQWDGVVFTCNKGDTIKVTVREITTSPSKKMAYAVLRTAENKLNFPLAKMVD